MGDTETLFAVPTPPPFESAVVTGAAGFVGRTLIHHLLAEGVTVIGLDRLSRGRPRSLPITVPIVRSDVREAEAMREAIGRLSRPPQVVFHLAGAARIAESLTDPDRFMDINAGGTQVVVDACLDAGVECVVLASTAAVLAPPDDPLQELDEDAPVGPTTPYGHSKLAAERTVEAATSTGRCAGVVARLFNPAGAAFGCAEDHHPETHLVPLAIAAALGQRPPLKVFGDDHPTPDGTCLRDYIHIRDVCQALVRSAANRLEKHRSGRSSFGVLHVGSGVGHSVLDVVRAVETATGRKVPYELAERRAGDMAGVIACAARMQIELQVRPDPDLVAMARDAAGSMGLAVT